MPQRYWSLNMSFAAACACAACAPPHVSLRAPELSAAPQIRMEAYARLRPSRLHRTEVTQSGPGVSNSYTTTDFVELADGRKVHHPGDLLPLVDERSIAADSMRDAERHRRTAGYLKLGALGGIAAGTAVMAAGFLNSKQARLGPTFYVGVGFLIGSAGAVILSNQHVNDGNGAALRAFASYDEALRQRLDLCEDTERVEPCP